MRKVVEFKGMGMGALAHTCGLGMALKAMADSEKNPNFIDGAPSLCNAYRIRSALVCHCFQHHA